MISQQRYNSLATQHQQRIKRDNRTSHKNTVQPCITMCTIMTAPNETDKSTPGKTITGEYTSQIGALQAIAACDTNVAFPKRNLFFVL